MGLSDQVGSKLKKAKDQATKAVADNEHKIGSAVDKAAGFADKKTKGKYADKITKATTSAKKGIDKVAAKNGDAGAAGDTGSASSSGSPGDTGPVTGPVPEDGPTTTHDSGPDEQQGSGSTP